MKSKNNRYNTYKCHNTYNITPYIFSPYHLQERRAHRSYCGRLAVVGGRGFQTEQNETQTETWQIYLAAQREWDRYPTLLDLSIIKGIETAMLVTTSHQCVHQVP